MYPQYQAFEDVIMKFAHDLARGVVTHMNYPEAWRAHFQRQAQSSLDAGYEKTARVVNLDAARRDEPKPKILNSG